jgi:hypothetical protein
MQELGQIAESADEEHAVLDEVKTAKMKRRRVKRAVPRASANDRH